MFDPESQNVNARVFDHGMLSGGDLITCMGQVLPALETVKKRERELKWEG